MSRQESWGRGSQGGPTEGYSSPQDLLCAPNAPSPERAMWQTRAQAQGPHTSQNGPLTLLRWLCVRGMAMTVSRGDHCSAPGP